MKPPEELWAVATKDGAIVEMGFLGRPLREDEAHILARGLDKDHFRQRPHTVHRYVLAPSIPEEP